MRSGALESSGPAWWIFSRVQEMVVKPWRGRVPICGDHIFSKRAIWSFSMVVICISGHHPWYSETNLLFVEIFVDFCPWEALRVLKLHHCMVCRQSPYLYILVTVVFIVLIVEIQKYNTMNALIDSSWWTLVLYSCATYLLALWSCPVDANTRGLSCSRDDPI